MDEIAHNTRIEEEQGHFLALLDSEKTSLFGSRAIKHFDVFYTKIQDEVLGILEDPKYFPRKLKDSPRICKDLAIMEKNPLSASFFPDLIDLLKKILAESCNAKLNDFKDVLETGYINYQKPKYQSEEPPKKILEDIFALLIDQVQEWVTLPSNYRPDYAIARGIQSIYVLYCNMQSINRNFDWENWIRNFIEENRRLRRLKKTLIETKILSTKGKILLR